MGFDTIIALDLGKFKSVACVMDGRTRRHRFETLDTTPQRLHELFVAHAAEDPLRTLVVVEACDAAGWVHDLARALGLEVAVANCCHEAWKWRKVKRKTDKDDAHKLAKMALNDELPTVHVPAPPRRQKRRLILHRRALVARHGALSRSIAHKITSSFRASATMAIFFRSFIPRLIRATNDFAQSLWR
jgi:hypothetical protein